MFALGKWAPYINEPLFSWYELPANLADELAAYRPNGREMDPLPDDKWGQVYKIAAQFTDKSVEAYNNPWHNPWHFKLTVKRGMQAVCGLEALSGLTVPAAVKQYLAIALRTHDCLHCGATLRADSKHPLHYPKLGVHVSQELVSSIATNSLMRRFRIPAPARLFQVMVILASTFGGNTRRGQQFGIPLVQPEGFWGCLMRASDVCVADEDIVTRLRRSVCLLYGEVPIDPPASAWDEFIEREARFLDYVQICYRQLDEAAGNLPITKEIGWRRTLTRLQLQTKRIRRHSAAGNAVETELLKYGVTLR